ncbi:MAG: hypothetical protein DMG84_15280 [Acidobacteria bacterium]|nr:MAG: hypothetical protein DMG84_15280 [Acidobacteriota bacterium]
MTDSGSAKTAEVPFRNQLIPNLERWQRNSPAKSVARQTVLEILPLVSGHRFTKTQANKIQRAGKP